ncbi:hypothetical protein ACFWYW_41865 [Nonomuraea sp. NPDC059023]|uniref:hypothetical protein n=1 Tax=unclassified Nonomuraea TaxID=2593643 RepID=UPI0036BC6986
MCQAPTAPLTEAEASLLLSVIWCGRSRNTPSSASSTSSSNELRLCGLIHDKGAPSKAERLGDEDYLQGLLYGVNTALNESAAGDVERQARGLWR